LSIAVQCVALPAGGESALSSLSARRSIAARCDALLAVAGNPPPESGAPFSSRLRLRQIALARALDCDALGDDALVVCAAADALGVDAVAVVTAAGAVAVVAGAEACALLEVLAVEDALELVADAAGRLPGSSLPPQPPSTAAHSNALSNVSTGARRGEQNPPTTCVRISEITGGDYPSSPLVSQAEFASFRKADDQLGAAAGTPVPDSMRERATATESART
jgi:hypothetical protein